MKCIITGLVAATILLPLAARAAAPSPQSGEGRELAIDLGSPFRDHAILQREMAVPVWGWSKPGATVTVEFAGQKKSTTAGDDGKWMLALDPLDPHFIYTLPGRELAPKLSKPTGIKGNHTAYGMSEWLAPGYDGETRQSVVGGGLAKFLEAAVDAVYK